MQDLHLTQGDTETFAFTIFSGGSPTDIDGSGRSILEMRRIG